MVDSESTSFFPLDLLMRVCVCVCVCLVVLFCFVLVCVCFVLFCDGFGLLVGI